MSSRRVIGALIGAAAFVVAGTAVATPPASPPAHPAPHAATAHPAAPHAPLPPTEHAASAPAVIRLSSSPHAPQAEIHLAASLLTPQRRLAIAQAREAASITESSPLPENAERYGTTAEKYKSFVTVARESDPHRYERAIAHLQDPTFGLPVTTNEHGQRVIVVYHGGTIPDGAAFDVSKTSDFGVLGQGVYFTPNESLAVEYAQRASGSSSRQARVIRIEIPVGDVETGTRTKLVAAPLGGVQGRFDGAMILNVSGYNAKNPDTYGAFTDGAYVNQLPHKTIRVFEPPPSDAPPPAPPPPPAAAKKGWLSRMLGR